MLSIFNSLGLDCGKPHRCLLGAQVELTPWHGMLLSILSSCLICLLPEVRPSDPTKQTSSSVRERDDSKSCVLVLGFCQRLGKHNRIQLWLNRAPAQVELTVPLMTTWRDCTSLQSNSREQPRFDKMLHPRMSAWPRGKAWICIWVSFPRTGEMAISCPFFLKSRALVWPNRKR